MRTSYQVIAILILAALVAATPSQCPSARATVTVTIKKTASLSISKTTSSPSSALDTRSAAVPVTITFKETVLVLSLKKIRTTSAIVTGSNTIPSVTVAIGHTITAPTTIAPEIGRTVTDGGEHMTIAITNAFGKQLSLSFASNAGGPSPVGNPSATTLSCNALTQYAFPTGWAGRVYVGPNLNPNGSKIEGSYTGPPDIDVSYVDGYSVPITCSSGRIVVSGCNIDLFEQPGIPCNNLVDGPVCLNTAHNIAGGPAPPFFAACAGAAYTYPDDNDANASNLENLISCCIGTSCKAPSRQSKPRRRNVGRSILSTRLRRRHNMLRPGMHG